MTTNASRKTVPLALAAALFSGVAAADEPLPPIGSAPPASRLPARRVFRAAMPNAATAGFTTASFQEPKEPEPLPLPKKVDAPPAKKLDDDDPFKGRDRAVGDLVRPKLGNPQPGAAVGKVTAGKPLVLRDVLDAVDRHFPLIRAAEQERAIAAGARLAAQGAFDVNLRSQEYWAGDTFDNQRYNVGVDALTPFHGVSYYAGYRLGAGTYPVYDGGRKTGELGELRAGANIPFLRNRAIDPARATIAKADLDRALAEPSIQLTRIDASRQATTAYWQWSATGQRFLIARDILRIATQRDEDLGKRVRAGNLAEIDREDNRRIIIERQARLVAAQRSFEQASIQLSLYLRDSAGQPCLPTADRLPAFSQPEPPPVVETRLREFEAALQRRPEIQRLQLQRRKIDVDLALADNQTLPNLSLGLAAAQDYGKVKKDLYRNYGELSVLFDVPLQRRNAFGRIFALRGEAARILAQEQFARDRVQIEVQNALNGLDRAYDLLGRGRDNRLQAAYIEEAERRLFDVGKSDLFRVNIRELATAEARFLEIDAVAEFYRALAEYYAALGFDPSMTAKGP